MEFGPISSSKWPHNKSRSVFTKPLRGGAFKRRNSFQRERGALWQIRKVLPAALLCCSQSDTGSVRCVRARVFVCMCKREESSQRLALPSPGHRTHENANASRISALAREISFKLLAIAEYPTVPFFPPSVSAAGRSSDFIPPFFNPVFVPLKPLAQWFVLASLLIKATSEKG